MSALRLKKGDRVIVARGRHGIERDVIGAGPQWVKVRGAYGRFQQGTGHGDGNGRIYDVAEWPRVNERADSDEQIGYLARDWRGSRWLTDDEAKRVAGIVREARARDLAARGAK